MKILDYSIVENDVSERIYIPSFWKEYQTNALKTVMDVPGIGGYQVTPLAYRVLGLCGEVAELIDVKEGNHSAMTKEVGDVLWYFITILDALSLSVYDLAELDKNYGLNDVYKHTLLLGNIVKKIYRDDEGIIKPKSKEKLINSLSIIFDGLKRNFNLKKAAEQNIEKLFSRKERGVLGGSGDNR